MAIKYEYYNTGDDDSRQIYDNVWRAQTFTPDTAHTVTSVKLLLYKIILGTPGTITVSIRATSASLPTGGDLCSGTTDGDTLTTDALGEWREISLGAGYALSASTMYAIVIRAPDGNYIYGDYVRIRVDETSPTYTGGTDCYSTNSGSSWTQVSGTDLMFEEWGSAAEATISIFPTFFRP